MMAVNEQKLRRVLKGNALFSLLSGTTLLVGRLQIGEIMGVDQVQVLLFIGPGLMLFSVTVLHAAFRKRLLVRQVQSIIVQDWVWVAGSGVVIGTEAWGLNTVAYQIIAVIACIVAGFALLQMRYLRLL